MAACGPEVVQRPETPPVDWASLQRPRDGGADAGTTDKERGIIDIYVKALGSSGAAGFADLGRVVDDATHFTFAGTMDAFGIQDVIKAHAKLFGAYEPRRFAPTRILRTADWQVLEWTMTGEDKATHRPVGIKGLVLLRTKDAGTIADIHLYFDEAVVLAQLGKEPKALQSLPLPPVPTEKPEEIDQVGSAEEAANLLVTTTAIDTDLQDNEARYLAAMTDDVELNALESALPLKGKKPVGHNYFAQLHKAIDRLDTQLDHQWGIGRYAVVEYHIVGLQKDKLGFPVPFIPVPQDPVIKLFAVDVVELRDGKIARVWRYDNPFQVLSLL